MQVNVDAPLVILLVFVLGGLVWLSKWIGSVNEHKSTVAEFMKEIRADIKRIFRRLPSKTLAQESPIRLTPLGEEIAKALDAPTWAERQAGSLRGRVAGKAPYRVQDVAFEFARYEYRPDEQFEIKLEAVAYTNGVTKEEVLDVLAIALRDELAGPEAAFDNPETS